MKNKKSLKLAASVVLSVVFAFPLSSCGPDEPIYHPIRQELKDWGTFKEGTWWVYEEESIGIRDSIYIVIKTNSIKLKLKTIWSSLFLVISLQIEVSILAIFFLVIAVREFSLEMMELQMEKIVKNATS